MERAEVEPAKTPPLKALRHPDAWSARWAILLAVVSLVAWIAPTPYLDEDIEALDRVFPLSDDSGDPISLIFGLVQPAAALAACLAVRMLRGVRRGTALACVALVPFFATAWLVTVRGGPGTLGPSSERTAGLGLALLVGLAGGGAVAVGNHLRRRSPIGGPARTLGAVGGLPLMMAFVIPLGRRPMIAMFFDPEARRQAWPLAVVGVLVLAYAFLGVRQLGAAPGDRWLTDWTSRLGRILLVVPPLGHIVTSAGLFADAPFQGGAHLISMVVPVLKGWGAVLGIAGAFAVGVAAYLEGRIDDDAPLGPDPESTARTFE